MDRDEVFRRMREQGYTWYGDGEDDRDGVFVKEGIAFGGIAWAIEYLLPWRLPVDELLGDLVAKRVAIVP